MTARSKDPVCIRVTREIPGVAEAGEYLVIYLDGRPEPFSVVGKLSLWWVEFLLDYSGHLAPSSSGRDPASVLRSLLVPGDGAETREPGQLESVEAESDEDAIRALLKRVEEDAESRCGQPTATGYPCRRRTNGGACWQHGGTS